MNSWLKKLIKVFGVGLIILTILFLGVAIFFRVSLDQGTIKNKLVQLVHDRTGRDLNIRGGISFTFFPTLGVKLKDLSVSNYADFSGEFAHLDEAEFKIRLFPLLLGRFEFDQAYFKGLDLFLTRNSNGRGNWQEAHQELLVDGNKAKKTAAYNMAKFSITDFEVENGKVIWQDHKNNQSLEFSQLDFVGDDISFNGDSDVELSCRFVDRNSLLAGDLKIQAKIFIRDQIYKTSNLSWNGRVKRPGMQRYAAIKGSSKLIVDLPNHSLKVDELSANFINLVTSGSLTITNFDNQIDFAGKILFRSKDLAELMSFFDLGKYYPRGAKSSLKVMLIASKRNVNLPVIEARIDEMKLNGQANYINDGWHFDLNLNQVDVSKFNSTASAVKRVSSNRSGLTTNKKAARQSSSLLNNKVEGKLRIDALKFQGLNLYNFSTQISGGRNFLELQNCNFNLYQGNGYGYAKINLASRTPKINLKIALEKLRMQQMLEDLAKYNKFSGEFNLNADLELFGDDAATFLHSVSGSGQVVINNGVYQGMDIPYEVRRVHSMLNGKPSPVKTNHPHTSFDRLNMTFNARSGLLNSNDLMVVAPDYTLSGKGNVNLISSSINFDLSAQSQHDKNFFIPVRIGGTFKNPNFRFDAAVMVQKVVKDVLQNVISEQVDKHNLPEGLKNVLQLIR